MPQMSDHLPLLLAPPFRARPDDLGLIVLLPYQVRALLVGAVQARGRRQQAAFYRGGHASERLEQLRLTALPAVVKCDACQMVIFQHVQRHTLHSAHENSGVS